MENKIIIFDFEVFKYDTLLGAIEISDKGQKLFQSWDLNEIREFYKNNTNSIWIGHNNECYDNFILQAILENKNPKKINDEIINDGKRKRFLNIKLYYYDLMKFHLGSLKVMEAFMGKDISESEVDFNLDRELTLEEKLLTQSYNKDDLDQTLDDFNYLLDEFSLRLDLIKEYNLPLSYLCATQAKISSKVLGAKRIENIENMPVLPKMWDTLRVNNKEAIDFYMNRKYASGESLKLMFGKTVHYMKAGGMHGAIENCYFPKAYYLDVSGYYNLIMINLDLLPRSIPEKGRELYKYMYHEQLRLKKINPRKRQSYKVILLAVFGAMNNEYCDFYDPYQGDLVRMSGQIFLVDLLEKLSKVSTIIQSNTDGIMCYPLEGYKDEDIKSIIDEWQKRTGFVLKFDTIYDLYQRDVNNYIYVDGDGKIHTKGEAVKYYGGYDTPYATNSYMSKEPLIISKCIVNYCIYGKLPEETVEEEKAHLRMFQSICKQGTFDYMEYEEIDNKTGLIKSKRLQKVNRAFAYNNKDVRGMVYKRKYQGKTTKAKVTSLPDNVFIYNNKINDGDEKLMSKINYQYYIDRAYERIWGFIGDSNIK